MSKTQTLSSHNIKTVVYSDFFTDFSVNSATGRLNTKTNEIAVTQSVRNLLLTDHYERPFQPNIGSNLRAMLFENFTPATELQVETYVKEVFDNHEPRANLIEVSTIPNADMNSIGVTIVFSIINSTAPTQMDLMIERVR
jgi:phage baseplate assembly protein W|tara:strand:+ start:63 stop:482 length:420 start_codon:yes stop_codon:yes gene_type:complete